MKRIILFSLLITNSIFIFAQGLSVVATGTVNTDCIGQGCFYSGPTILINEVMLAPNSYDGSMVGSAYHTTGEGEWIELYNPHKCDSVDISCYFLGNNAYDNTYMSGDWGGGFVIPPGTVVPPQGFAMVRGSRAPAVPSNLLVENGGNVVEIIINRNYCLGSGGGRLWFPNAGGWFAFYDANGVPQDAISWCSQSNSCMSCPPCNPMVSECGYYGQLASYDEIPNDRKNYISTLNPQNTLGQSFRRIPDGGVWQSYPDYPTYATCNDICVDPPLIYCNAIAVATPTGGTLPYSFQWDDPSYQTTDTAFGLCAGTYTVTVTDANMQTATAQVTIVDYEPPVTHPSTIYCLSDSFAIVYEQGFPLGGSYIDSNNLLINDSILYFNNETDVYPFAYTYTDTNGCSATTNFTISVYPEFEQTFYDTICQYDTYNQYNFVLSTDDNSTAGDFSHVQNLTTQHGCDSIVTLNLSISDKPNIEFNPTPDHIVISDNALIQFINITDLSGNPNGTFTWQWDYGDGNTEDITDMTTQHFYDEWGEYIVTLSFTSEQGCRSSISHTVYVDAELEFPNVMTPNDDGVNDVFAIRNLNPEQPNILTIYNRWGKKVYEKENYKTYCKSGEDVIYNATEGFNAEGLSDGVYFYTFHYEGYTKAVDHHSTLTVIRGSGEK